MCIDSRCRLERSCVLDLGRDSSLNNEKQQVLSWDPEGNNQVPYQTELERRSPTQFSRLRGDKGRSGKRSGMAVRCQSVPVSFVVVTGEWNGDGSGRSVDEDYR
jgi:hypothetical protein